MNGRLFSGGSLILRLGSGRTSSARSGRKKGEGYSTSFSVALSSVFLLEDVFGSVDSCTVQMI